MFNQVHSKLTDVGTGDESEGMIITLEKTSVLSAVSDLHSQWRHFVNLRNPGPFGMLEATRIQLLHQHGDDKPINYVLNPTAEQNIGHDLTRLIGLFDNFIGFYTAVYWLTERSNVALQGAKDRMVRYLRVREFGVPWDHLTALMFLRSIQVMCSSFTRLFARVMNNEVITDEAG